MLEIRGGYGVPPSVFYLRGDTALISPRVAWGHGEGMPPRGEWVLLEEGGGNGGRQQTPDLKLPK